ncbi:serine/threonine protein kinase [Arthrobacter sp. E918]|uniref:non-specific serine/threonine protein kinase n=2 Tax=Arthrobacter mobilis TaxID=2724944 RepID=A0A7X6K724_9MICC|nr:serine/threonine protein kinase [Arthrobacter mobilis]
MGVVYRALDVQLGRPVALKLLAPELSANEKFRLRFVRESRLAASVDHPNILPVYGAGEWSGQLYIVMRYVRGTDLKAELDSRGRLPLAEVLRILSDTAAALDAAHAAGLVHRDVKPGNILLSDDRADGHRHVYLTDFGLTKRATSATGVTTAGHFLGTLDYVAPEQIRGEDVDGRADVYALACVAYTLLAGHPPFDYDDDSAQLWAHMTEEPPRLAEERPEVPATVGLAILAGMAKQREDRPASCGALVAMMSGGAPTGDGLAWPPEDATAGTRPTGAVSGQEGDDDALTKAGPPGPAPKNGRSGGSLRMRGTQGPARVGLLAALGAALVLLLAAGLLLPRVLSGDERVTFRADGVPYTLEVPESWTPRTREAGDSTVSVLSGADLTALFADEPDAPAAAARTATDDPDRVVGLTIYHRPAGLSGQSPAARVGTAEALLPGRDAHLVDRGATTVGEVEGQAMEGTMPLSSAVTLQVRALVVETEPVQLLVFFAPSSLFEERTEVFSEVAGSLRRTE